MFRLQILLECKMAVFLKSCSKNNLALLSNRDRRLPRRFRFLKSRTNHRESAPTLNWWTEFKVIKLIRMVKMFRNPLLRRRLTNWRTSSNNITSTTTCSSITSTTNRWRCISNKKVRLTPVSSNFYGFNHSWASLIK